VFNIEWLTKIIFSRDAKEPVSDLIKMKRTPLSFSMKTEMKKFHSAKHKKITIRHTLLYLFHFSFLFM
jgi:hypothetical protein